MPTIDEIRNSFTVYIVDSEARIDQSVLYQRLQQAGYQAEFFANAELALGAFRQNPPHILFFRYEDGGLNRSDFLNASLEINPELHVILLAKNENMGVAGQLLEDGAYDCVPAELTHLAQAAADRAADRDYYMYMNEQILENQSPQVSTAGELSQISDFLQKLEHCRSWKEAIDCYLEEVRAHFPDFSLIYLKYLPSYHSLAASQSLGIAMTDLKGVGIDLNQEPEGVFIRDLKDPMKLQGLEKLVVQGLQKDSYVALPFSPGDLFHGIFVFVAEKPSIPISAVLDNLYLQTITRTLSHYSHGLEVERKLHTASIYDETTYVLNRHNFLKALTEEFARSRRTTLPVSLVIASVDEFGGLSERLGHEETDILMRMLATLVKKSSRVNDIVGRISSDEFGLILPHTGRHGAAIKAERLRKIIESVDFTRSIKSATGITLSMGVCEYPSHCHDPDEILQLADDALFQVKKAGKNKICLATAPQGFIPDFIVDKEGTRPNAR